MPVRPQFAMSPKSGGIVREPIYAPASSVPMSACDFSAPMPGYDSDVIMAAGAFVQGSSIELSADGPVREPYAVYYQGGLTWYHAKLGVLLSLQKMLDAGLITLP